MAEQTVQSEVVTGPELRQSESRPAGVMRRNIKTAIFLGASLVVIAAALISDFSKRASVHSRAKQPEAPPQPALVDNTDNNVQDLKNQLAAERQREAQLAASSNAATASDVPMQPTASTSTPMSGQVGPCIPGQPCQQQGAYAQPQISPEEQQAQLLAAKERELAYSARFASNLVYTHSGDAQAESASSSTAHQNAQSSAELNQPGAQMASSLVSPRPSQEHQSNSSEEPAGRRNAEVNIDSAKGQPYVVYEGLTMDSILMNRLDGDAPGPVKVMVSSPVYSHDRQHVLIPDGTVVLGEVRKIGSTGFGQQRRMAVAFHRMIMPDGYSVDLDQFHGLDQIGEEGLKDKVDNHYLQIFGTSIALGLISGAGEIEAGGGTISTNGSQAFMTGAASSVSQSATTALDMFIQIPPTITIREGHRIKVYFVQDLLLPAYDNHTIPQTF